jgi:hypothetical protein
MQDPRQAKFASGPLLRNRRKRHLVSLRIPELVALRVHAKLSGRAVAGEMAPPVRSDCLLYGRDFVDVEVLIAFFPRQVAGDARAGEIEQKVNVHGVDLND